MRRLRCISCRQHRSIARGKPDLLRDVTQLLCEFPQPSSRWPMVAARAAPALSRDRKGAVIRGLEPGLHLTKMGLSTMQPERFQHILFPADYSPRCIAAVPFVKEVARRNGSRVTVFSVAETLGQWPGLPDVKYMFAASTSAEPFLAGQKRLAEFVGEHFPKVPSERGVTPICQLGDAAYSINYWAERNSVDLIMMPTHGYGPFRSLLLGSVTAKILHDARCAVWTAAHLEEPPLLNHLDVKNIVCAVDLKEESCHLIHRALEVAAVNSAVLRLLHVVPIEEARPPRYFYEEMQQALAEAAREQLAGIERRPGRDFIAHVESGGISKAVRQFALDHHADLIVIGRGTLQAPLGRLRSNAYAIIRDAPCPVLSV
jgi:nucleotide-binding universal stress UspA family protein